MIAIGMGVLWWGYLQAIYGYTLLKGYNITWRQLANPIHPYQWPVAGTKIPTIPKGQIMPGKAPSTTTTTASQPGSVVPGTVPGGPGTA